MTNTVKTANSGGCGDSCACHCHSDVGDIPPDHIEGCLFADPDYVPPDFELQVHAAAACLAATTTELVPSAEERASRPGEFPYEASYTTASGSRHVVMV